MSGGELLGVVLPLLAVIGAVLALGILARRVMPGLPAAAGGEIRTLAAVPLDARHRAVLLRCRGRDYLLVLGSAGTHLVDRLEGERT